jgi:hypothetical protein
MENQRVDIMTKTAARAISRTLVGAAGIIWSAFALAEGQARGPGSDPVYR